MLNFANLISQLAWNLSFVHFTEPLYHLLPTRSVALKEGKQVRFEVKSRLAKFSCNISAIVYLGAAKRKADPTQRHKEKNKTAGQEQRKREKQRRRRRCSNNSETGPKWESSKGKAENHKLWQQKGICRSPRTLARVSECVNVPVCVCGCLCVSVEIG